MFVDEPTVGLLIKLLDLGGATGDDIGDPEAPLVADTPFPKTIALEQPGGHSTIFDNLDLSIRDHIKGQRLSVLDLASLNDDFLWLEHTQATSAQQFLPDFHGCIVQIAHQTQGMDQGPVA